MGLDCYLYRCADWDASLKNEAAFEEASEKLYSNGLDEEERNRRMEALRAEYGMTGEYGGAGDRERVDLPSERYPDNICRVGYFRSSYNEGGLNNVLALYLGEGWDLHYIMGARGDEYYVRVDWAAAADRAREVIARLDRRMEEVGSLGVIRLPAVNVASGETGAADSREAALRIFEQERARRRAAEEKGTEPFTCYQNRAGLFQFGEQPFRIRALIAGTGVFGEPTVYGITEDEGLHESYRQSLEVVLETCEWVLAQDAPAEQFRMAWSG